MFFLQYSILHVQITPGWFWLCANSYYSVFWLIQAHFIMLFAERSNVNPNAQAPGPSASCAAPSTSTSPETTPGSVRAHQESAWPQAPQPSSIPVVVTVGSLVPSHLAPGHHSEGSSFHQKPTKCSNLAEVTNAAPPAMPFRVPATEGSSRQLLQQCLNGPSSKREYNYFFFLYL